MAANGKTLLGPRFLVTFDWRHESTAIGIADIAAMGRSYNGLWSL